MNEQQRRRRNQLRLFTVLAMVLLLALPLGLVALGANTQVTLWVSVVLAAVLAAALGMLSARR
jgi:putative flippase GtrA